MNPTFCCSIIIVCDSWHSLMFGGFMLNVALGPSTLFCFGVLFKFIKYTHTFKWIYIYIYSLSLSVRACVRACARTGISSYAWISLCHHLSSTGYMHAVNDWYDSCIPHHSSCPWQFITAINQYSQHTGVGQRMWSVSHVKVHDYFYLISLFLIILLFDHIKLIPNQLAADTEFIIASFL